MIEERGVGFLVVLDRVEHERQRLLRLAELEKHPRHAVHEGRVLGFELHGLLDHVARAVQLHAALGPHIAEIIQRVGEIRGHFQTLLEIFFRLLEILVALVRRAELEIKSGGEARRFVGARPDFGGGQVPHGLGIVFEAVVGRRGEQLDDEVLFEFRPRFFQHDQPFLRLIQRDARAGEIVIGLLHVGIEQRDFLEISRGFLELLFLVGDQAENVVRLWIRRVLANDRLQLLGRLLAITAAQIKIGQALAKQRLAGKALLQFQIQLGRAHELANRPVNLRHPLQQNRLGHAMLGRAIQLHHDARFEIGHLAREQSQIGRVQLGDIDRIRCVVGLHARGLVGDGERFLGFVVAQVNLEQRLITHQLVRQFLDRRTARDDRLLRASVLKISEPKQRQQFAARVGSSGRAFEHLDGLAILLAPHQAPDDVHDERLVGRVGHCGEEEFLRRFIRLVPEFETDAVRETRQRLDAAIKLRFRRRLRRDGVGFRRDRICGGLRSRSR